MQARQCIVPAGGDGMLLGSQTFFGEGRKTKAVNKTYDLH